MRRGRSGLVLGWVALTLALFTQVLSVARAAIDDQIDSLAVDYTVNSDGSLQVTERIVYRFGASSERRGLERTLVTRQPYDTAHDMVFEISDPVVSSPSQAPTTTSVRRDVGEGRTRTMRVLVGDTNRRIDEKTAAYQLSYTVRGALRSYLGYDELYWDMTGPALPKVLSASATVQVPGGVEELFCSTGRVVGGIPCHSQAVSSGVGTLQAFGVEASSPLTIAAKIHHGLVAGNGPNLIENAELTQQRMERTILIGGGVAALLAPLLGWWFFRRHGYDRRFDGWPPGELPPSGQAAPEVRDRGVEVPLVTSPPKLALVEAGLLMDGQAHVRQTTATLVGLAVDGAIKLRGGKDPEVRLLDPRRARDRPSAVLLEELFGGGGTVADLTSTGLMVEGHDRIIGLAHERARDENWFVRIPSNRSSGTSVIAALAIGYIAYTLFGAIVLYAIPLLASVVATFVVLNRSLRRGQRTGRGRALTDQAEGFRRYLSQVEADQLRFEPGEDIFSRFLPWAILFDLTDRWTKVCQRLVAQGRLSSAAPAWYSGPTWSLSAFSGQLSTLTSSVGAATTAPDFSGGTGRGG